MSENAATTGTLHMVHQHRIITNYPICDNVSAHEKARSTLGRLTIIQLGPTIAHSFCAELAL